MASVRRTFRATAGSTRIGCSPARIPAIGPQRPSGALRQEPSSSPFLDEAKNGARGFSAISDATGWLYRVVYKTAGLLDSKWSFSDNVDICTCGLDISVPIPRPELVVPDGVERGSREWRTQLYGAALYWHLATTPGQSAVVSDKDMLRDKDVLEVACMRGGGARYLMEVVAPKSYVATERTAEQVEFCIGRKAARQGLSFVRADGHALCDFFAPESFDVVLCVQGTARVDDLAAFIRGVAAVLRPGGRFILYDSFTIDTTRIMIDAMTESSFVVDAVADVGRQVHAVGLCQIHGGVSFLRIVARKVEKAEFETQVEAGNSPEDAFARARHGQGRPAATWQFPDPTKPAGEA